MNIKPLAYKLRPNSLSEVIGQKHLIGENKILTKMVNNNFLQSFILYGKPGIGKNSIANAISKDLNISIYEFNASTDDKKKLVEICSKKEYPIIIFIDEIHRLDKPKQDYLLSFLETGQIILIGATTENPYINITPAIRSRVQIFELLPLNENEMEILLYRLLNRYSKTIEDKAKNLLIRLSNGEPRTLINTFELIIKSKTTSNILLEDVKNCYNLTSKELDKDGDNHYNLLSAFQKSIRGSDVDASLHYLAKLIVSGDLISICRRLQVIAFEDIGIVNIEAINLVCNAVNVAFNVGLPEAKIPLSVAVIHLALSPKSNSAYTAINAAICDLDDINTAIPNHLKDTHFIGHEELGHKGYLYPFNFKNHLVKQQYLPNEIKDRTYFEENSNMTVKETSIHDLNKRLKKIIK